MNALRQRLPAGKAEVFTMRPFWGLFVEPKLLRALSARASPVPSVHAASLPQATRLPRAPPSLTAANTSPGGKAGGAAPCSALAAVTLPRQSECRVACGAPPPARYLPASPSHQPPCRPPLRGSFAPEVPLVFQPRWEFTLAHESPSPKPHSKGFSAATLLLVRTANRHLMCLYARPPRRQPRENMAVVTLAHSWTSGIWPQGARPIRGWMCARVNGLLVKFMFVRSERCKYPGRR